MEDKVLSASGQQCLQGLLRVWFEFERQLGRVPIVQRLQEQRFDQQDYLNLLLNLRQQVIEGSRWISRTASSFDREFADIRSLVIAHAQEEHRDYELLEQDYLSAGGKLTDIQNSPRNVGSEALHAFLMYRGSQANPLDMIGAMWIIEGLGHKMAENWADQVDEALIAVEIEPGTATRFMRYHGDNDDQHLEKLYTLIDRVCAEERQIPLILRTARVVAKLYILQLEEVDG